MVILALFHFVLFRDHNISTYRGIQSQLCLADSYHIKRKSLKNFNLASRNNTVRVEQGFSFSAHYFHNSFFSSAEFCERAAPGIISTYPPAATCPSSHATPPKRERECIRIPTSLPAIIARKKTAVAIISAVLSPRSRTIRKNCAQQGIKRVKTTAAITV